MPLELTPAQKHLYATETGVNFRLIAKLVATRSSRILTSDDLVSSELQVELAEYSQFVELSYDVIPVETVYRKFDILTRPGFPFENSDAIRESKLLKSFHGKVADLHALTAYRPSRKQLVLAISGTRNARQVFYDLRAIMTCYPRSKGCKVHTGFWELYRGIKESATKNIRDGIHQLSEDIREIVITGHSMGGAIGSLLALDLLLDQDEALLGRSLKLVFFGAPRVGNAHLVELWHDVSQRHRREHGADSLHEYFVKGYNDGVPSLPPHKLGYRHLTKQPLYFARGQLYYIPPSECEHGFFDIHLDTDSMVQALYPKGGHNYYSDRDSERFARRSAWLAENMDVHPDWEKRYYKAIIDPEQAWQRKTASSKPKHI
ncbi:alpha/beta-hydrolase [Neolentinus lepideus HHB14362 ss-1]|uniref:Alpha/beta-hydrolase n=1 Tax=Neolentinus lepideus HHB14362 ss-1 TaxID=1314782 RepID=A0A165VYV9_9AGAM|nr:alpha/beta-hydrolase [Neolentinus lepideus HHB14362 ss-1]